MLKGGGSAVGENGGGVSLPMALPPPPCVVRCGPEWAGPSLQRGSARACLRPRRAS